ncbi:MAG: 23S rRNA (cytidine(2498)-2'-O)-methyltransferase RlmM [Gammaproteobacteria bacterium]|jgi:23S rRNA (cytidine2498-2'-O)-methyltransferase
MKTTPVDALLAYCRPGFENDLAAELTALAASHGVGGFCRARADTGWVEFRSTPAADLGHLINAFPFSRLVFARQWWLLQADLTNLPEGGRAGPIASALTGRLPAVTDVWLEYPDTNEGKALSNFCARFRRPLLGELEKAGLRRASGAKWRLHLLFPDSSRVFAGLAPVANSATAPLGIRRLRMPPGAPSRSTLKLEEALRTFLDDSERQEWLRPGLTAVDLGASPGGWSWQFIRRSIRVTAVDNGPMDKRLIESGILAHRREDGFRYRPDKPVDWLVCDMVEKPQRIVELMADWLVRGDARRAIFNLKLPMKQRYACVAGCLDRLQERLDAAGPGYRLHCRQLYHDREEVTVGVFLD